MDVPCTCMFTSRRKKLRWKRRKWISYIRKKGKCISEQKRTFGKEENIFIVHERLYIDEKWKVPVDIRNNMVSPKIVFNQNNIIGLKCQVVIWINSVYKLSWIVQVCGLKMEVPVYIRIDSDSYYGWSERNLNRTISGLTCFVLK